MNVSERQLRSWEKQELIPTAETFDFNDILALRTLVDLRAQRVPAGKIGRVVRALREKLGQNTNPLKELKLILDGSEIHVVFAGGKMEPVSGQLLLNFDAAALNRMLSFPKANKEEPPPSRHRKRKEAEIWFERGLELERCGAPMEEIIEAYEQATAIDPGSAGALVNLGTVYFNARSWRSAEKFYRKALEVQPDYALAHFNLGNLFDEKGERTKALHHYEEAIKIYKDYADAHYNVALLYQSLNQPLKAVHHWREYLKLDRNSSWADIARRELGKLKNLTVVPGTRPKAPEEPAI